MNRSIRRIGLLMALLFLTLFVNLNYIQLARSTDLAQHPRNQRRLIDEFGTRRGEILAADGTVLAESRATGDARIKYYRRYPLGSLFGHITGYYTSSVFCGADGLELSYNEYLNGEKPGSVKTFVDELLGRKRDGNVIKITIDPTLQALARRALGGQRGGVAAIDPKTGAVLALWGNPSYDPNVITRARGGQSDCGKAKQRLESFRSRPMQSRAFRDRYPAGSTFKIITAAAGLESKMTARTTFPDPRRLDLPDTNLNLRNFQGGSCVGGRISMYTGMLVSCNTTFAQVAMRVGQKRFLAIAEKFGLQRDPDIDIPAVASCVVAIAGAGCDPRPDISRPALAYSGIGQQDVRVTPLQMARVAATVANDGRVPKPYLVASIIGADGRTISKTEPELSKRIYSRGTARDLRRMMIGVVTSGTGRVVGFRHAGRGIIGGKTGTAQTGTGEPPHVWFVAFGPGIAVAVVVENGGRAGREATGGRVAGPIAKALVDHVVARGLKDRD